MEKHVLFSDTIKQFSTATSWSGQLRCAELNI